MNRKLQSGFRFYEGAEAERCLPHGARAEFICFGPVTYLLLIVDPKNNPK